MSLILFWKRHVAKKQPKNMYVKFKKRLNSNDFALFFARFLYLGRNFPKINIPKTLILHLAYSFKIALIILFKKSRVRNYHRTGPHWQQLLNDVQNGHKPKRPQTKTATNQNGHKPKRPQSRTATGSAQ